MSCQVGAMYEYLGQTERCSNERVPEKSEMYKNAADNSVISLQKCTNCYPVWDSYF